ncbi:hypothetical protein [Nocardia xishanensis]|uniref:hypothetical protein n=1 Tax=Nocardia xishanensis TaxID=238964 RepID=UPI000832BC54|nr:hypothetical protein [Nocardia xishanensis]
MSFYLLRPSGPRGSNGYEFGPVTTSISSLVEDSEDFVIPPLSGLVITGRVFVDDFSMRGRSKLIASGRAAEFLFARDEIFREYSSRLDESGEIIIDL